MIQILAVGKLKAAHVRAGTDDYRRRIRRFANLEVVDIPDSSPEEEGRRILAHKASGPRIVCDLSGELWSSQDIADRLGQHGALTFIIGGPDGLARAVKREADEVLKLSGFTLPHELARLVLLEQIYRGFTILRGHPYHR